MKHMFQLYSKLIISMYCITFSMLSCPNYLILYKGSKFGGSRKGSLAQIYFSLCHASFQLEEVLTNEHTCTG